MSEPRVSRNDPCPCGNGRKYKKCCYHRECVMTPLERLMAIKLIEQNVESCDERRGARSAFFGDVDLDGPAMTEYARETCESAFLFWFAFDRRLADDSFVVGRILKAHTLLSAGERRFLEQMRSTAMLPFKVLAVRPGGSVVLRRLGAQEEIEVREKSASETLKRWDVLVTRLNPVGPTGGPEIEMGTMLMPPRTHREIAELFQRGLSGRPDGDDEMRRLKDLVPIFHKMWLESVVASRFPSPLTTEGDPMMLVMMRFSTFE